MTSEPTITFLELARAIGADSVHERTIEGNLELLYRGALLGEFSPDSLNWNGHALCKRRGSADYLLASVRSNGSLDFAPEHARLTPRKIIEILAGDFRWPLASRALELFKLDRDAEAHRLVAEGPVPDETKANLFVGSLAITLGAAWHFCERHGLPVPPVIRQQLGPWTARRKTKFAPEGYLSIPDAVMEVRESLAPGEAWHARTEITANPTGELPESYHRHCRNEERAEKLLLQALFNADLKGLTTKADGDRLWPTPADYWGTDGARMTLSFGELHTSHLPQQDRREHHGQPCFIETAAFRRWLDQVLTACLASEDITCRKQETPDGPDTKVEHLPPTSTPMSNKPLGRRRGRRPTYDWEAFQVEIARRVGTDPDGFPVVQAVLEREMTDWCIAKWGENGCPVESTIREHIAKYYRTNTAEGR